MDEQVIKNIEELAKSNKLKGLVKDTLSEIELTRKSIGQYLVSGVIAIVLSGTILFNANIIAMMSFAAELLNNTVVAFIAIIFGTYAVFQALMTDSVTWALLKSEVNLLNISNKSFLHLVLLYIFDIAVNIVLLIFLKMMPAGFCLFSSIMVNNFVAFFLCFLYFGYNSLILYEIKNFAINLYRMFSVYNIYHSIEILEKKKESESD